MDKWTNTAGRVTYEPKKDCTFYRENRFNSDIRECACLTELVCTKKEKCSFYKAKKVIEEE